MTYSQLYLPSSIPQWEIFLAVVFVIIGYVEKKEKWSLAGWILLIITALTSLYFNLFGDFISGEKVTESALNSLKSSGWQAVCGGVLAVFTIYFQRTRRKNYNLLAILTLIYFMLIFFEFNYITRSEIMARKAVKTEQEKK